MWNILLWVILNMGICSFCLLATVEALIVMMDVKELEKS